MPLSFEVAEHDDACPELSILCEKISKGIETDNENWVSLLTDHGTVLWGYDDLFVDQLSDHLLRGWRHEDPAVLKPVVRAVYIANHLAKKIGLSIRGFETRDGPDPFERAEAQALDIRIGDNSVRMFLVGSSFDPESLSVSLANIPIIDLAQLRDPGFPLQLRLKCKTMTAQDTNGLCPGTVVVIQSLKDERFQVSGRIPGALSFQAQWIGEGKLQLDSIRRGRSDMETNETYEQQTGEMDAPAKQPTVDQFDLDELSQLPVQLDFRFAPQRINLKELSNLGVGYTLEVDIDLSDPITIFANGKSLGRGELVQVSDKIGVEITQWPTD
ncbi:FliM/FliN family flagellar motor switch protein [uncultured Tateyamaria sp.]|uniref:FliM/FliN family flagellar motor switch protein n=1 Tax=uncultured Tateyamaria sp. TaxID=455651 RepID=UPI00262C2558|nr:FliM/FliN family flagellar motor switch protein [uncultured Tateyamaria sp.]